MDKKITSSVVLASFATTQFGLLNVSAENNDAKEAAANISKEIGEGGKSQGKLGAQSVEKLEDVEKVEKKMDNLEKGLDSRPATYSKVVDSSAVAIDGKGSNPKPADSGVKAESRAGVRPGIKVGKNKTATETVNLNKRVSNQSRQENNISTFGKLKNYLGNMFGSSGKKENKFENKKNEDKNLKTDIKKTKTKKSPVTKKKKVVAEVTKDKKPGAKTKTEADPQKAPAVSGEEIKKVNQKDKPFSKTGKSNKLFSFAPSKETKMFLGGAGMLMSAYAADRLLDSLKDGARKSNVVPTENTLPKVNPDKSENVAPGSEFINSVGGGLRNNAVSYPLKSIFVADRKVRKSIGEFLDSFSKDNANDILDCKGNGFNGFSKSVKDLNLASLSADDLLGKNKKDFLEALKKLSITDKEVGILLNKENIEKFKNTLQQAGLSAETVEALLGKDLKRFSRLLGNAAIKSDNIYAILEKNFGNFEEEIKNTSLPLEAIKYIGSLVLSIPEGFLFWPKLTVWLWRKLSESGAGTETKIVAALAFAAFYVYKYIWSFYKIYKAYKENAEKNKKDQLGWKKFLFTNGHVQKLSYDIWLLRHVLRPLLATTLTEESGGDKKKKEEEKNWLDKLGDKLSPLAKPSKVAAGVLWRLTPISIGWGLLTDWLPSFLKGADTLEAETVAEWQGTDLGMQEDKRKKAENERKKEEDEKKKEEDEKKEREEQEKKELLNKLRGYVKKISDDINQAKNRYADYVNIEGYEKNKEETKLEIEHLERTRSLLVKILSKYDKGIIFCSGKDYKCLVKYFSHDVYDDEAVEFFKDLLRNLKIRVQVVDEKVVGRGKTIKRSKSLVGEELLRPGDLKHNRQVMSRNRNNVVKNLFDDKKLKRSDSFSEKPVEKNIHFFESD